MSQCRFCQQEISWEQRDGRNVPKNADGSVHNCKRTIARLLYLSLEEANQLLSEGNCVYLDSFFDLARARPMFVLGEKK